MASYKEILIKIVLHCPFAITIKLLPLQNMQAQPHIIARGKIENIYRVLAQLGSNSTYGLQILRRYLTKIILQSTKLRVFEP